MNLPQNLGFPDKPLAQSFDDAAQRELEQIVNEALREDMQNAMNRYCDSLSKGPGLTASELAEQLRLDAWGLNMPISRKLGANLSGFKASMQKARQELGIKDEE